jgi:hypothetical protein
MVKDKVVLIGRRTMQGKQICDFITVDVNYAETIQRLCIEEQQWASHFRQITKDEEDKMQYEGQLCSPYLGARVQVKKTGVKGYVKKVRQVFDHPLKVGTTTLIKLEGRRELTRTKVTAVSFSENTNVIRLESINRINGKRGWWRCTSKQKQFKTFFTPQEFDRYEIQVCFDGEVRKRNYKWLNANDFNILYTLSDRVGEYRFIPQRSGEFQQVKPIYRAHDREVPTYAVVHHKEHMAPYTRKRSYGTKKSGKKDKLQELKIEYMSADFLDKYFETQRDRDGRHMMLQNWKHSPEKKSEWKKYDEAEEERQQRLKRERTKAIILQREEYRREKRT